MYKQRFRVVFFALKDAANKELRARVALGEITPAKLARMSEDELANKEISQWRAAVREKSDRMSVLDPETAASFSTAASAALRRREREAAEQARRAHAFQAGRAHCLPPLPLFGLLVPLQ